MPCAVFHFHGELDALLAPARRGRDFAHRCAEHASLKHAIESLGVPHTEIGRVCVDGRPGALDEPVHEGCRVDVFPAMPLQPGPGEAPPRFLADAHLGALARQLRLLGFDTLLANDHADHELALLARDEDRIVLSRDRELLKHRLVHRGRWLRSQRPDAQLAEVAAHYALRERLRPFSRCLECNGLLAPVAREAVLPRLPPAVAAGHREFVRCAGCGRVYWPGTHWQRLMRRVEAFRTG